MASRYVVQIVDKTSGIVAAWAPGMTAEREFISELCERVAAKPVGMFRTSAQVKTAVRDAAVEMLRELKQHVPPPRVD